VRAYIRRIRASVLIGTGLLASLLGGCGGHSTPAPLLPSALLSDFNSTAAGSQYAYSSVLVTSGHGTRSFVRAFWPRHVGVEMSCRGGPSVTVMIGRRFLVKVYCAPGLAGGGRMTIGRNSVLAVTATPSTRWSLLVAAGNS
jgi:hypothetical protein